MIRLQALARSTGASVLFGIVLLLGCGNGSLDGSANAVGGSGGMSSDGLVTSGTGNSADGGTTGSAGTLGFSGSSGASTADCSLSAVDSGPAPLQRLTPVQYRSTIQELFGPAVDATQLFPNEKARAHIGLLQPDVSQFDVETYANYAELIASAAAANATQLVPCDGAADLTAARACMTPFLETFGQRIYRTPLSTADLDRLLVIFELGFQGAGYSRGLELTLQAMLQSPRFLYRPEFGDETAQPDPAALSVPLSSYEIASRLAFAFWNSTPDAALLAAAASGTLTTQVGRDAELARLIADPRARETFRNFLYAWFGMGDLETVVKDATTFPTWQTATPGELKKQSDAFFDEVLFGVNGTLTSLFNSPLGPFAPDTLADWQQSSPTAAGILTLPALLAVHSKAAESFPIYRGLFVREQLLCQPLPPPPPAAAANPPQAQEGVSTRVRFEQHSVDNACSGCHKLIDPIGFAFENYDAIGRYRTLDRGLAIDSSGNLAGTDVNGPFNGVGELSTILSQSAQVQACTARQWFRYVMQRFDQGSDACSTQPIIDAFAASGSRFDSLQPSVVNTPAFLLRRRIILDPTPVVAN